MLFHNRSVFIYSTVSGRKCEINIIVIVIVSSCSISVHWWQTVVAIRVTNRTSPYVCICFSLRSRRESEQLICWILCDNKNIHNIQNRLCVLPNWHTQYLRVMDG